MSTYNIRFAHSDTDRPGSFDISAQVDTEAVSAVRSFVAAGYRNGTWASILLRDGRTYVARNQHGKAHGAFA